VLPLTRLVGLLTRDVTVHPAELDSLIAALASCDGPAAGRRRCTDFLAEHADGYGRSYVNEVRRTFAQV
jgi:hypothetical protein